MVSCFSCFIILCQQTIEFFFCHSLTSQLMVLLSNVWVVRIFSPQGHLTTVLTRGRCHSECVSPYASSELRSWTRFGSIWVEHESPSTELWTLEFRVFFYVVIVGIRYSSVPSDSDRCYRFRVGLPAAAIGLHGSVVHTVRGYSSLSTVWYYVTTLNSTLSTCLSASTISYTIILYLLTMTNLSKAIDRVSLIQALW